MLPIVPMPQPEPIAEHKLISEGLHEKALTHIPQGLKDITTNEVDTFWQDHQQTIGLEEFSDIVDKYAIHPALRDKIVQQTYIDQPIVQQFAQLHAYYKAHYPSIDIYQQILRQLMLTEYGMYENLFTLPQESETPAGKDKWENKKNVLAFIVFSLKKLLFVVHCQSASNKQETLQTLTLLSDNLKLATGDPVCSTGIRTALIVIIETLSMQQGLEYWLYEKRTQVVTSLADQRASKADRPDKILIKDWWGTHFTFMYQHIFSRVIHKSENGKDVYDVEFYKKLAYRGYTPTGLTKAAIGDFKAAYNYKTIVNDVTERYRQSLYSILRAIQFETDRTAINDYLRNLDGIIKPFVTAEIFTLHDIFLEDGACLGRYVVNPRFLKRLPHYCVQLLQHQGYVTTSLHPVLQLKELYPNLVTHRTPRFSPDEQTEVYCCYLQYQRIDIAKWQNMGYASNAAQIKQLVNDTKKTQALSSAISKVSNTEIRSVLQKLLDNSSINLHLYHQAKDWINILALLHQTWLKDHYHFNAILQWLLLCSDAEKDQAITVLNERVATSIHHDTDDWLEEQYLRQKIKNAINAIPDDDQPGKKEVLLGYLNLMSKSELYAYEKHCSPDGKLLLSRLSLVYLKDPNFFQFLLQLPRISDKHIDYLNQPYVTEVASHVWEQVSALQSSLHELSIDTLDVLFFPAKNLAASHDSDLKCIYKISTCKNLNDQGKMLAYAHWLTQKIHTLETERRGYKGFYVFGGNELSQYKEKLSHLRQTIRNQFKIDVNKNPLRCRATYLLAQNIHTITETISRQNTISILTYLRDPSIAEILPNQTSFLQRLYWTAQHNIPLEKLKSLLNKPEWFSTLTQEHFAFIAQRSIAEIEAIQRQATNPWVDLSFANLKSIFQEPTSNIIFHAQLLTEDVTEDLTKRYGTYAWSYQNPNSKKDITAVATQLAHIGQTLILTPQERIALQKHYCLQQLEQYKQIWGYNWRGKTSRQHVLEQFLKCFPENTVALEPQDAASNMKRVKVYTQIKQAYQQNHDETLRQQLVDPSHPKWQTLLTSQPQIAELQMAVSPPSLDSSAAMPAVSPPMIAKDFTKMTLAADAMAYNN